MDKYCIVNKLMEEADNEAYNGGVVRDECVKQMGGYEVWKSMFPLLPLLLYFPFLLFLSLSLSHSSYTLITSTMDDETKKFITREREELSIEEQMKIEEREDYERRRQTLADEEDDDDDDFGYEDIEEEVLLSESAPNSGRGGGPAYDVGNGDGTGAEAGAGGENTGGGDEGERGGGDANLGNDGLSMGGDGGDGDLDETNKPRGVFGCVCVCG
jgi:hypothetical protein